MEISPQLFEDCFRKLDNSRIVVKHNPPSQRYLLAAQVAASELKQFGRVIGYKIFRSYFLLRT